MPHFIIDHTDSAQPHDNWNHVFKTLFETALQHPTMNRADMKGRARQLEASYMDDGDAAKSYVHLELAVLTGREPDLKRAIGEALLEKLPTLFRTTEQCQFSVEIRDMNRDAYFKQSR